MWKKVDWILVLIVFLVAAACCMQVDLAVRGVPQ
jgi:hypothetical protein